MKRYQSSIKEASTKVIELACPATDRRKMETYLDAAGYDFEVGISQKVKPGYVFEISVFEFGDQEEIIHDLRIKGVRVQIERGISR